MSSRPSGAERRASRDPRRNIPVGPGSRPRIKSALARDDKRGLREGVSGGGNFLPLLATIGISFALSACGFHPLYGDTTIDSKVAPTLAAVYVEPVPDRVGYDLRNQLLDLFNATGQADGAVYRLQVRVNETEDAVVLQTNTAITRYNYTLTAHYDLIPRESTSPVKSGDVTALSAYNVAAAPFLYSTVQAERDAKSRAANDIVERIRTELAVYLRASADKMR